MLPDKIGQKWYGRPSDGSHSAKQFLPPTMPSVPSSSSQGVHQQGFNPFIQGHDVQLKHVLRRWVELVESGHWKVDQNGVAGDIEKWREADSAAHWRKYQLSMRW